MFADASGVRVLPLSYGLTARVLRGGLAVSVLVPASPRTRRFSLEYGAPPAGSFRHTLLVFAGRPDPTFAPAEMTRVLAFGLSIRPPVLSSPTLSVFFPVCVLASHSQLRCDLSSAHWISPGANTMARRPRRASRARRWRAATAAGQGHGVPGARQLARRAHQHHAPRERARARGRPRHHLRQASIAIAAAAATATAAEHEDLVCSLAPKQR